MALVAMMLTGACSKEDNEKSQQDNESSQQERTPFDADGATVALFTVKPGKQVRFSRGNLQYQASTDTWRFAERQYEIMGEDNCNISESNDGWIDLFGWGTSGWESGAIAYQPWASSRNDADYLPGGSAQNSLTGSYSNADWGVFNAISNGGNRAGIWRTLTNEEWRYLLFSTSPKRSGKWAKATVGSMTGMVILPDEWELPEGLNYVSEDGNGFSTNVYAIEQWDQMETAGAVFLPAAGFRDGYWAVYQNEWGAYWSVSPYDVNAALCMVFNDDIEHPSNGEHRRYGMAVRLVKE